MTVLEAVVVIVLVFLVMAMPIVLAWVRRAPARRSRRGEVKEKKGGVAMSRRAIVILVVVVVLAAIGGGLAYYFTRPGERVLNVLAWVGYDEPDMVKPFEGKYNVKLNVKTFVGGDQMFALLTESRNTYDVVVVDPEYIAKLHAVGRLSPLKESDYDFTNYFEPFENYPGTKIDGKLYAVVVRFGANALVYNSKYLTEEDVKSYDILWDPKIEGKVGIWGWYLPTMGTVSKAMGHEKPYELTEEQFEALKQRMMELRPQVAAIHDTPPEVLSALANEETWIVPAAGESWAAALRLQGKPISWA